MRGGGKILTWSSIQFAAEGLWTVPGTPTSKAEPFGVIRCEIWMKIGDAPPVDLSECEFVALDNRTPKTVEFERSDANKTVHFIGRWQDSRVEKGPLSETVSATVTG